MSTTYKDDALVALKQFVAEGVEPPTGVRTRQLGWKPRLVLGAVAATLVAGGVTVGVQATSTPAFAVERQANGSVTVTINRLSDSAGLERKLTEVGLPAVVNYLQPGKWCGENWIPQAAQPPNSIHLDLADPGDGRTIFTLKGHLGKGQRMAFIISDNNPATTYDSNGQPTGTKYLSTVQWWVAQGAVPPCKVSDAPTTHHKG